MASSSSFYLNCYLLGDKLYDPFPIEVTYNLKIASLKAKIMRHYKEFMGDELLRVQLYQIDLLSDPEKLAGIKLPSIPLKSALRVGSYWKDLKQLDENHTQVLVEAEILGGDQTHGRELAPNRNRVDPLSLISAIARLKTRRDQTAEAFRDAGSASTAANHRVFEQQQVRDDISILNGRPQRRSEVPIQLFHPAFDHFATQLKEPAIPKAENYLAVEDFLFSAQQIYDDKKTRWSVMKDLLSAALGHVVGIEPINQCESDGVVIFRGGYWARKAYGAMIEINNEVSTDNCDPCIQGAQAYSRYWSQTKMDELRAATRCPSLIIFIAGPWMCILGAVYLEHIVVQPLTEYVWLGHHPQQDHRLTHMTQLFAAISSTITFLQNYYTPLIQRRPVYEAITKDNHTAVVKFAQSYNFKAHKLLADRSLAPKLLSRDVERVGGELLMVVMELSSTSLDNYLEAHPKLGPSELYQVQADIEMALSILHENNLVFGDLRRPNVLVIEDSDGALHGH
ncbi:hypothetical protein RSOLAG22IIIB_13026 [Rhizoctonia solani]|uniref:Protein kinase domain-containing protein n=1 Tax=Rhizoctonia solani TaxID=456999 RepID=A0A0K6GII5_9AGAM|nr:hypothetical protein RSOLAG22IIIB_13026 [Rhizoctonia solani]